MTSIAALGRTLEGRLFSPGRKGYGAALRGGGSTPVGDRRPAVIVQPAGAGDVARAIGFARERSLALSVRAGGHDMLGASTTHSGVLVDLCRLDRIAVDAGNRIARVGGGVRSGALLGRCDRHGLAPVLGMSPNVGIGGLALGGGIGWISGRLGATVDHVLAVDVVLADGRAVTASAEEHPDLFWALRGGGGNFGVATGFSLRLHPLDPVLAGELQFATTPRRLLPFVRELLAAAGDALDLGTSFTLGADPVGIVELCWSGDPPAGERLLRRLRAFAPPQVDTVRRRRLARFVGTSADASRMVLRGTEFDGLTAPVIDAVAEVVARGGPDGATIGLLHFMHGALCRPPADATPFVRPEGHILCNIVAPTTDRARGHAKTAWTDAALASLAPASSGRVYPNYLCDGSPRAVAAAYGANYRRLREIKRRYDPDNLFRGNRNIRP